MIKVKLAYVVKDLKSTTCEHGVVKQGNSAGTCKYYEEPKKNTNTIKWDSLPRGWSTSPNAISSNIQKKLLINDWSNKQEEQEDVVQDMSRRQSVTTRSQDLEEVS